MGNGIQSLRNGAIGQKVDLLLREVDCGFDVNPGIEQHLVDCPDAPREFAAQGTHCRTRSAARGAVHEVGHRFRLGEVDLVVQEGPLGELAGLGEARAKFACTRQQTLHHHGPAVALQFQHVLSR